MHTKLADTKHVVSALHHQISFGQCLDAPLIKCMLHAVHRHGPTADTLELAGTFLQAYSHAASEASVVPD